MVLPTCQHTPTDDIQDGAKRTHVFEMGSSSRLRFLSLGLPQIKRVYVRKPRTGDDLKVSIREEIATVPQEIATVPQEIETVPQEIVTVTQEIVTVTQEILTVTQEIGTVTQEIATVPQEIATVPQEIATVPQEMLVNVMQNFEERLRTRVRQEGRHLSDIIFRK